MSLTTKVVAPCYGLAENSCPGRKNDRGCPRGPAEFSVRLGLHIFLARSHIKPNRWIVHITSECLVYPMKRSVSRLMTYCQSGYSVFFYLVYKKECEQLLYVVSKSVLK